MLCINNMNFKTLLNICLTALLLFGFGCEPKQETSDSTFSISVIIKNPQTGKIILSQTEDVNRKKTRVIGELPIDEEGKFSKDFDLEPHIYQIDFYGKEKITLAIDKGQKLKIIADGNDLKNIRISGSEDTDKFLAYEKFRNESLERLVKSVRVQIEELEAENNPANQAKIEKLGVAEIENYETHRDELNAYIKDKMGTSIAIYPTTLRWDGDRNTKLYESLAKSFEQAHPNSAVAERINEKVAILKNTSIGGTAAEIKMTDKNGREITLNSIRGKYILIDFWASWCGPCRRESGKIVELYDKYKDEGFEVYSVSLDSDKKLWLDAIEKDERTWTNVSSLQGFETPATFEYAVTALPAKFIIDAEGKIVAKNLHGGELKEKIDKLFSE